MRRARRTHQGCSSQNRLLIGMLLIGLCSGLHGGLGGLLLGTAAAQPKRSAAQKDDVEVPGSRGAGAPTELTQIDESQPQPRMTPVQPVVPAKPAVTCCTPGVDCPCTPGVDCPCTPGVDCQCTAGRDCACTPGVNCPAKPPQRSDFCVGKNCPCVGPSCNHCTPGKNCACTPFIDCPDNEGVLFDKDSSDIRADTRENLIKFATALKVMPLVTVEDSQLVGLNLREQERRKDADTRIRIEGHVTADEMNRTGPALVRLAMSRAAAVKKALIEAGLPEAYIAGTRGYGPICRITIKAQPEDDIRMNRAVAFIYNRDRTGCAFPDGALRPPVVADLPPKPVKGAPTRPAGPKTGGAKTGTAPKPAGTK